MRLHHNTFAATSHLVHQGRGSRPSLRLHFRALGVGLIHIVLASSEYISDPSSLLFSYNDALRHKERKLAFDVDGLRQLAAESVNQNLTDVVSLSKLTEGGFNRTFIITLRSGQQMVAHVPYPMTGPKYYAVACEVATIE